MFRSVVVTLLFLISPSLAPAQEMAQGRQQTTHEVVKGETLWTLAERYLGNPYRWPLLYEANASSIPNPNLLEPGQVLVIPGIGGEAAQVQSVLVVTQGEAPVPEVEAAVPEAGVWVQAAGDIPPACPGPDDRTLFFTGAEGVRNCPPSVPAPGQRSSFYTRPVGISDVERMAAEALSGGVLSMTAVTTAAVPRGLVYASDWLVEDEDEDEPMGTLAGVLQVDADWAPQGPARIGQRIQIAMENGDRLRVGDLLQSYRSARKERGLGTVLHPTGVLVVSTVGASGITAVVSSEFDRIQVGDWVRSVPEYGLQQGAFPMPVESNVTATVLGFPEERPVQGYEATVFLDIGEDEGITVGDIFRAPVIREGMLFGMEAARLQVVVVNGNRSTARIVSLTHPGLGSGDLLRLIEKMQ